MKATVEERIKKDLPVSLHELRRYLGVGYDRMKVISKMDGFPMIEGLIVYSVFMDWWRSRFGIPTHSEARQRPDTSQSGAQCDEHTARGSASLSDLSGALPHRAALLSHGAESP